MTLIAWALAAIIRAIHFEIEMNHSFAVRSGLEVVPNQESQHEHG